MVRIVEGLRDVSVKPSLPAEAAPALRASPATPLLAQPLPEAYVLGWSPGLEMGRADEWTPGRW
jgi:hypothetical protein